MPRLKYGAILRVLLVILLFAVWLQIMFSASGTGVERDVDELMNSNDTSAQVLALVPRGLHKYLTVQARNNTGNPTDQTAVNIREIKRLIQLHNEEQIVHNEDVFGPVQNDTVIIAIQVHTRLTYLRHLIVSLAQARDIDRALLVFSHDYYDEEINNVVKSIDFCKVMQIFYPYSIQTHPNEFPGMDPNDCPRDSKIERAKRLQCNNALHPDVHGHYREAKYTQTKHHWWWKANRIFDQLSVTAHHTGPVLFLEEDHYVAEDFLYMLRMLRSTADIECPQCEILCLGTYLKTYQYHRVGDKRKKHLTLNYIQQVKAANEERRRKMAETQSWSFQVDPNMFGKTQKQKTHLFDKEKLISLLHRRSKYPSFTLEVTPWHSSLHNMGFAFNRTVWTSIVPLKAQFCDYDDYNWDYSLLHLSQNRPGRQKFKVVYSKAPRVFHIGECGIHHKKTNCDTSAVVGKVQQLLLKARPRLYPTSLTTTFSGGGAKNNKPLVKGNGGWGDVRDHELCANMTSPVRRVTDLVDQTFASERAAAKSLDDRVI